MFKIFQYRLPMDGDPDDLNQFLATNRIATVKQQIVQSDNQCPLLIFVVETVGSTKQPAANKSGSYDRRIDYQTILKPEDFAVFSKLRETRKEIAANQGLPVFAILNNAQLAEMVTKRIRTTSELAAIEGIGVTKVEKFGEEFLAVLNQIWDESNGNTK